MTCRLELCTPQSHLEYWIHSIVLHIPKTSSQSCLPYIHRSTAPLPLINLLGCIHAIIKSPPLPLPFLRFLRFPSLPFPSFQYKQPSTTRPQLNSIQLSTKHSTNHTTPLPSLILICQVQQISTSQPAITISIKAPPRPPSLQHNLCRIRRSLDLASDGVWC